MDPLIDKCFRGPALTQIIANYVLCETIPIGDLDEQFGEPEDNFVIKDGEKQIQWLMDYQKNQMRIYGSARELADDLKIYRNFPRNHKYFCLDPGEQFNNKAEIYKSLKDEQFLMKNDLPIVLQSAMYETFEEVMMDPIPSAMIMVLLKEFDDRIEGHGEFVRFDSKIDEMKAGFIRYIVDTLIKADSNTEYNIPEDIKTFKDAFRFFKELIPDWNTFDHGEIEELYETVYKDDRIMFDKAYTVSKVVAEAVEKVYKDNNELFLPFTDTKKGKGSRTTIRVFEDGPDRFMMRYELFEAMNCLDDETLDTSKYLKTMSLKEANMKYGDRLKDVDLIHCPIRRTKHAVVPVLSPSGDHCIPAVDGFFEFIRSALFEYKVFQRIETNKWFHIIKCLSKSPFVPFSGIYFVTNDLLVNFEGDALDELLEETKETGKDVRNAKKDGFTAQNLKNEFIHLGLNELFPEITCYAEKAYATVVAAKKEKYLRTCDLFDAIENCVLICILRRFPHLKQFVHNQNACHRIAHLECDFCTIGGSSKEFWQPVLNRGNKRIKKECSSSETIPGNVNYTYFSTHQLKENNIKYFLLDSKDDEFIKKNLKIQGSTSLKKKQVLFNLNNFLKVRKDKNLYIRSLHTCKITSQMTERVFVEEALDLISILIDERDMVEKLAKYREQWKSDDEHVHHTIILPVFSCLFETFKVDKSRISIFPDPLADLHEDRMWQEADTSLDIFSSDGRVVMNSKQAVFHIFQSIVCDVNWLLDSCKKHNRCNISLLEEAINAMQNYSSFQEGIYFCKEHVQAKIDSLKKHCHFQTKQQVSSPLKKLRKWNATDLVPVDFIRSECSCLSEYFKESKEKRLPMWRVRNLLMLDMCRLLKGLKSFKNLENDCILQMSFKYRSYEEYEYDVSFFNVEDEKNAIDTVNVEYLSKKKPQKVKKTPVETPTKQPEVKKTDENQNIASTPPKVSESKCCSKCLRTSEKCNEAVKEMKLAQNKLEKYEKKAKMAMEFEKKTKEMEKEIGVLKKKNNDLVAERNKEREEWKRLTDAERKLKKDVDILESRVRDNQNLYDGLIESVGSLQDQSEKIRQLEDEIKEKNREIESFNRQKTNRNQDLQRELQAKDQMINKLERTEKGIIEMKESHAKLEKENEELKLILERKRIERDQITSSGDQRDSEMWEELIESRRTNIELRETNCRLSGQIEQQNMTIKGFLNHFGPIQKTFSNSSIQTEEEDKRHGGSRFQLLGLWKIKDTFSSGIPLKLVKEVIEKMKSLSDESEVHQMANYELQHYEGEMRTYLQTVEVNIEKIKKTGECSHLLALPNHPSLSDRFINRYWDCIDEKKKKMKMEKKGKKSSNDPTDSECLFCYFEMKSNEETLACGHCRKVTHLKCASKWLRINRSCPHCRREQLDPTEFPPLS